MQTPRYHLLYRQFIGNFFVAGHRLSLSLVLTTLSLLLLHPLGQQAFSQNHGTIVIDSVSVIDNTNIIIAWTLTTSVEDGFIEIHKRTETGVYAVINSVPLNRTFYLHSDVDATSKAHSYFAVARFPNGDPIAVSNEAHQTLFLHEPVFEVCDKLFSLTWQNYSLTTTYGQPEPLPSPFDRIRIMLSFNYSSYASVLQMGLSPQNSFIHAGQSGLYCLKISTVNTETGVTASSNSWCKEIQFPPKPNYLYTRSVSVGPLSEKIELVLDVDNAVPDPAYIIERFHIDSLVFYPLDTLKTTSSIIEYTDFQSMPANHPETYRISVLDSCEIMVLQSEPVSSVFLAVTPQSASVNQLSWNAYEGWEQGPIAYVVQKRTLRDSPFEDVAYLGSNTVSYTHELPIDGNDALSGNIYYRIMATGNTFSNDNFTDTIYSNVVWIEREVAVFIPNAFNPQSQNPQNRVFMPRFSFFSPGKYSMTIYDRWGGRMFETDNPENSWDGQMPGGTAPAGVYSYVIWFTDIDGNEQEKRGVVLLVR